MQVVKEVDVANRLYKPIVYVWNAKYDDYKLYDSNLGLLSDMAM